MYVYMNIYIGQFKFIYMYTYIYACVFFNSRPTTLHYSICLSNVGTEYLLHINSFYLVLVTMVVFNMMIRKRISSIAISWPDINQLNLINLHNYKFIKVTSLNNHSYNNKKSEIKM